jgi:hypothetical protein
VIALKAEERIGIVEKYVGIKNVVFHGQLQNVERGSSGRTIF